MMIRRSFSITALAEALEGRRLLVATPTDEDQYQLELINRARANPAAEAARLGIDLNEGLAAGTISTAVKQPLAFNPDLIQSATAYTMALLGANNYFNHFYQGTTPQSRMSAAGYVFSGSYTNGENIAVQDSTGSLPLNAGITNEEYQDLFIDSGEAGRGHRVNLMDGDFKEIGIGVAAGSDYLGIGSTPANAVLTTQDFAASDSDPDAFLTGVAFTDTAHTDFYAPGEGIGGLTIKATRTSDHAVFSTTTWSSGGYTLALSAGTYTVTASGSGFAAAVTDTNVVIGSLNVEKDFLAPPTTGSISGITFKDHNGDGIQEHNDPAFANLTVDVQRVSHGRLIGHVIAATSNASGVYTVSNLNPGTYVVTEIVRKGYKLTGPKGGSYRLLVSAGSSLTGESFGNQKLT